MRYDLLLKVKTKLYFDNEFLYINNAKIKIEDVKESKRIYFSYYKILFNDKNINPIYFISIRFFFFESEAIKKFKRLII